LSGVYAAGSMGAVLAAVVAGRVISTFGVVRMLWVSTALPGPAFLLIALGQPGWGLLFVGIALGAASASKAMLGLTASSYLRRAISPVMLGVALVYSNWAGKLLTPFGPVAGGRVTELTSAGLSLLLAMVGGWASALWVMSADIRKSRTIEDLSRALANKTRRATAPSGQSREISASLVGEASMSGIFCAQPRCSRAPPRVQ
jgi:hypothetical protein